ncbi:uncharacterized protein LOC125941157 [Dermacentor silvarum]|uniref:uncharacterized protein LOC125941157 n=1 Tax=Dermacentor silvarum TaxID=543639 RepID=UPI0021018386|nr:uncharacterized protein LOC125941157 [Dermacentor silvarum]
MLKLAPGTGNPANGVKVAYGRANNVNSFGIFNADAITKTSKLHRKFQTLSFTLPADGSKAQPVQVAALAAAGSANTPVRSEQSSEPSSTQQSTEKTEKHFGNSVPDAGKRSIATWKATASAMGKTSASVTEPGYADDYTQSSRDRSPTGDVPSKALPMEATDRSAPTGKANTKRNIERSDKSDGTCAASSEDDVDKTTKSSARLSTEASTSDSATGPAHQQRNP